MHCPGHHLAVRERPRKPCHGKWTHHLRRELAHQTPHRITKDVHCMQDVHIVQTVYKSHKELFAPLLVNRISLSRISIISAMYLRAVAIVNHNHLYSISLHRSEQNHAIQLMLNCWSPPTQPTTPCIIVYDPKSRQWGNCSNRQLWYPALGSGPL